MKNFSATKKTKIKMGIICALKISLAFIIIFFFYKCPFKLLFDIPCPGCGMTRAYKALLQLDFVAAFEYHLLFPLPILAVIYQFFNKKFNIGRKNELIALFVILLLFFVRWIIIL